MPSSPARKPAAAKTSARKPAATAASPKPAPPKRAVGARPTAGAVAAKHDLAAVMAELEAMGTEQNRKVYPRHGAQQPMFGVSYANLGKLTKTIGTDQKLAESLWKTTNHDARVLATMIADPQAISPATLREWAGGSRDYVVAGSIAGLTAKTPHARELSDEWRAATSDEWAATCGWDTLASCVLSGIAPWLVAELKLFLKQIEDTIPTAPNRVRHAMNGAIIAIGVCGGDLTKAAIATAMRIGKVEVDHGETSCKTPDAAAYIEKTLAHRASRLAKERGGGAKGVGAKGAAKSQPAKSTKAAAPARRKR